MREKLKAYCHMSGEIGFTTREIPEGTLGCGVHQDHDALKAAVATLATHAYDGKFLVPGLRCPKMHATTSDPAEILHEFTSRLREILPDYVFLDSLGLAVRVDGQTIYTAGLMADTGKPERDELDDIVWNEVTAPFPDFLDAVNQIFGTNFDIDKFSGR